MSQFFCINMSDEPIFVLLSKAASQLLFYVLAKLSTQVQVYALDCSATTALLRPVTHYVWVFGFSCFHVFGFLGFRVFS